MRRRLALTGTTALVVAFATATVLVVSAGSTPPADVNRDGSVPITLTEWEIEAPAQPIPAGRVVLDERNDGLVDHDLLLVKTDVDPADLPRGLSGPVPAAAGKVVFGEIHDHAHALDQAAGAPRPGESRKREVTLAPGNYALICPLRGHYANGQSARLVVE